MKRCNVFEKCQVNDSEKGMGVTPICCWFCHWKLYSVYWQLQTQKKNVDIWEKKKWVLHHTFCIMLKVKSPGCHYAIKEQYHPHLTGKSTVSLSLIDENMLLDSGNWDLLGHLMALIAAVSLKQAFWNVKKKN